MKAISIDRVGPGASAADVRGLAGLMIDAIDSNAGISFMPGLTEAAADSRRPRPRA